MPLNCLIWHTKAWWRISSPLNYIIWHTKVWWRTYMPLNCLIWHTKAWWRISTPLNYIIWHTKVWWRTYMPLNCIIWHTKDWVCIYTPLNCIINGWRNGLSLVRRQAINWTNRQSYKLDHQEKNFSEIWSKLQAIPFEDIHLKIPTTKM